MRRTSFADADCPIALGLESVGEWWTILILRDVFDGFTRFDDIQRSLGISPSMLTRRLKAMVDAGLLTRRRYSERPPRDEYKLTRKGLDLYPVLLALMEWGDRYKVDDPPVKLFHKACGEEADPQLVCSHCAEPVAYGDLRAEYAPGAW
jgi:DNA-binding HxlR family transcriptional regulator